MALPSDAIHVPVEIGHNVIIQIPDVDRAKADLRNIVGGLLQKDDQGFHKIGMKYGTLDKLYCRSGFDKCKEKFLNEDVPNTNLPLRTIAKEAAIARVYALRMPERMYVKGVSASRVVCYVIQNATIISLAKTSRFSTFLNLSLTA